MSADRGFPGLMTALADLLDHLAEAGLAELLDPIHATWSIGRNVGTASVALVCTHVGGFEAVWLPALAQAVGGDLTVGETGRTALGASTLHTVTGEWAGYRVVLQVFVHRTEREHLEATLADTHRRLAALGDGSR